MADDTISGLTPVITVSGLPSGPGSFSGATQGAPAGGLSGTQPGVTPGIEGGPGLDLLSMLLQQAGSGAGDLGVGALTPFSQQSLGQQSGGLSAGSFGQGGGQGLIAGAMGTGAGAQQQTGAGSVDPLSIIQKLLGLGSKAAGAAGSIVGTSSPTLGDTGGTSLSDQLRSQQEAAGGNATLNGITASPVITQEGLQGQLSGLQPGQSLDPQQLEALGQFDQLPSGTASPAQMSFLNQAQGGVGGIPQGTATQELIQSMLASGSTPDQIVQAMQASGFSAGEIPTGGSIPSGISGTPTASPTGGISGGGAAASGLGAGANLLSLIQALKSGSVPGEIGAGVNTAVSLGNLAQTLGVAPEALSGALGSVAPFLPLLGAALTGASINPGTPQGAEAAGNAALTTIAGTEAAGAAGTLGGGGALAAAAPALAGAAAPLAAFAPAVLGIALAINQALNPKTNYAANKESGIVGPSITSALNSAVQGVPQDLTGLSTPALESLIPQLGGGLQGLFNPAGAGTGTATSQTDISRYRAGLASADPAAAANIQAEQNQAQQGLLQDIALLQQRGVSNQDIGGLLGGGDAEAARIGGLNAGGGNWTQSADYASLPQDIQQAYGQYQASAGNPALATTPFGTGSYGNNLLNPNFQANALGGNTWYLLNKLGLDTPQMLGQYGIQAPGFNVPYLQGLMNPVLSNIAPPAGQVAGYDPGQAAGTA